MSQPQKIWVLLTFLANPSLLWWLIEASEIFFKPLNWPVQTFALKDLFSFKLILPNVNNRLLNSIFSFFLLSSEKVEVSSLQERKFSQENLTQSCFFVCWAWNQKLLHDGPNSADQHGPPGKLPLGIPPSRRSGFWNASLHSKGRINLTLAIDSWLRP